jgi:hypothetical protein
MVVGIVPVNRFWYTISDVRSVARPRADGIVPIISLFASHNSVKFGVKISLGIVPVNRLDEIR